MSVALTFDDISVLDTVDSTNDAARRKLTEGAFAPFVIASREQTKGRGRSGRAWSSQPGNLAATFYHPFQGSHQHAARLSFAVSLAVLDTIRALVRGAPVAIKWPNDVLLDHKKVCGILLENQGHRPDGLMHLLIGIGINLAHHPDPGESNWPPTSIASVTGTPAPFDSALKLLIQCVESRLRAESASGFEATRTEWLSHAARLRETIDVRLPSQTLQGVFRDIDDTGALVLETASGVRKVTAGDVFFPRDARCS